MTKRGGKNGKTNGRTIRGDTVKFSELTDNENETSQNTTPPPETIPEPKLKLIPNKPQIPTTNEQTTTPNNETGTSQQNMNPANPAKRLRSDSDAINQEDEVFEAEIMALERKMQNSQAGDSELISSTFLFIARYLPRIHEGLKTTKILTKQVFDLQNIVTDQQNQIEELNNEIIDIQIANSSKNLIIKNLPQANPTENDEQLKEAFDRVLDDMQITEELFISDIFRLNLRIQPSPPSKQIFRPVKICFQHKYYKQLFLKNLKNLRQIKNLKITMDCPKKLLPEYRIKEKEAYDIRSGDRKIRTLLAIKNRKIVILAKKANERSYSEISFNQDQILTGANAIPISIPHNVPQQTMTQQLHNEETTNVANLADSIINEQSRMDNSDPA